MLTIVSTEFRDMRNADETSGNGIHFGVCMYDEDGNTAYDNALYPDGVVPSDDIDVLKDVVDRCTNTTIEGMLWCVTLERDSGVQVNNTHFSWKEISHILD